MEAAVVTAVFHLDTAIHHDFEAAGFGNLGGFVADDAQLQPQPFSANGDGLLGNGRTFIGRAEDIYQIYRFGDAEQVGVGFFTQDFGGARVDGNNTIPLVLLVGGDEVGRPLLRGR